MCREIQDVEKIVYIINDIHKEFSDYYFNERGKDFEVFNLSHTINTIPKEYILSYRLYLHENINDYLMRQDLRGLDFLYRVKTSESIEDKIYRYSLNSEQYPLINWMNDIFGARVLLDEQVITEVSKNLDIFKEKYGLKNWYLRDKQGYKGYHIYFKNQDNRYFPWELQIWDKNNIESNIESHKKYKRSFLE